MLPEVTEKILIVNAPWTFSMLWTVLKMFMDKNTVNKVEISSGNPIEVLSKYIDVNNIPVFLGGTCKDLLS